MKTLRASEIGSYLYCQRAWWMQRQDFESSNLPEMATGTEMHYRHGRQVLAAGLLRLLSYAFLLAAIVVLVTHFTSHLF